jgi:hypothetical protein
MGYANVFRALGFNPYLPAGKTQGFTIARNIPTTPTTNTGGNASVNMAIGDAYALDASGNAYRAGPGDTVRGIVLGFRFLANPSVMGGQGPVSIDFFTSGTASATLIGLEDPTIMFSVQCDTFAVANIGMSINLVDAAPDSTLRQSRQSVSISNGVGTQFRVIDLVQDLAANAVGANAQIYVSLLQSIVG